MHKKDKNKNKTHKKKKNKENKENKQLQEHEQDLDYNIDSIKNIENEILKIKSEIKFIDEIKEFENTIISEYNNNNEYISKKIKNHEIKKEKLET